jgi:hypothetical protein
MTGRDLDLDTLATIAEVQDSGKHSGVCPNWIIPGRIPVQRLTGLKRRGYLTSEAGIWWLTDRGCKYLDMLREDAD